MMQLAFPSSALTQWNSEDNIMPIIIIIILLIAFWDKIEAFCLAVIKTIAAIIVAISVLFTTDAPQAENQTRKHSVQHRLMCSLHWDHRVTKGGTEYCVAPKPTNKDTNK